MALPFDSPDRDGGPGQCMWCVHCTETETERGVHTFYCDLPEPPCQFVRKSIPNIIAFGGKRDSPEFPDDCEEILNGLK